MWARITIESHEHWHPRTMMIPSYFKIWSLMMIYSLTNKTSEEEYMINIYILKLCLVKTHTGIYFNKDALMICKYFKCLCWLYNLPYFFSEYKLFLENIPGQDKWNKDDSPFLDELMKLFLPKPLVWHNCYSLIMQSGQCLKRKLFHESINSIKCTTGEW